ncbi:hypothetical protein Scep_027681 [Stephania cephalantha]|uniref:Uncharacterized protein n=1 Tax=Stephania cephalantha TaxID=152367 RepID=A0AAP0EGU7_9MAGN
MSLTRIMSRNDVKAALVARGTRGFKSDGTGADNASPTWRPRDLGPPREWVGNGGQQERAGGQCREERRLWELRCDDRSAADQQHDDSGDAQPARCGDSAAAATRRGNGDSDGARDAVEQQRGGALLGRSIPDDNNNGGQGVVTSTKLNDAMIQMDFGLETSIEGHETYEAIVGCRVHISRRERDVLRTICDFSSGGSAAGDDRTSGSTVDGWSSGGRGRRAGRQRRRRVGDGSDAGKQLRRRGSDGAVKGSDRQRWRASVVTGWWLTRPASSGRRRRRQRGGAVSTGRTRDFDEITTTRWRDLGVGCRVRKSRRERDVLRFAISRAIVEIVVDRVGPMASESRLLFICDMSSYPDAVDISQLSVRWGHLSGP